MRHFANLRITTTVLSLAGAVFVWQAPALAAQSKLKAESPAVLPSEDSMPKRVFISGHSLTNQPVPSDLAAIAASLGHPLAWNRQYLEGSSIKQRSRGQSAGAEWSGYSQGLDDAGRRVDVLAELRRPKHHPEQPYDTLLITEQHSVLVSLVWNEMPRYLRDFHDRFIAQNAQGATYFFLPWLSLDDKNDPRRWIAYERSAAPVWRCAIARTNEALASDGRRDRVAVVPAALALAQLIEQATQGSGVPGITRNSTRATVDSLVADNVHLTRLGNYYIALATFASMYGKSPKGAWRPPEVTAQQADVLQDFASAFAQQTQPDVLSATACRSYVRGSFMWTYLNYIGDTEWREERGYLASLYQRWKVAIQWLWLFSSERPENPLAEAAYRKR